MQPCQTILHINQKAISRNFTARKPYPYKVVPAQAELFDEPRDLIL